MKKLIIYIFLYICLSNIFFEYAKATDNYQIPTVSVPTVTSSPGGAIAIVTLEQEQINVRSGPNTNYPVVGVLIAGQRIPAIGRSVGGDWVQIAYPGVTGGVAWVYSPLVIIEGSLPLVEPPPTPTPRTTPTIDPTLAAQFIVEIQATRLPTFTAPPSLTIPTYEPIEEIRITGNIPMGLLVIGLGIIGFLGVIISFLQGR